MHGLSADLAAAGVWIDRTRQNESYGRFAWIKDCDGSRVELWQPLSGSVTTPETLSWGRRGERAWCGSLSGSPRSGTLIDVRVAKFHPAARDALRAFPEDVRRAFGKAIHDLQLGHSLAMPLSRPIALGKKRLKEML